MHVFRALSGGRIRFQYLPGPTNNAVIKLYNNTIDVATGALGTARLLYTYTSV